jgi:3-hydroxyisobutyrate dehydrogenase-like beta-hydroxyacid dehydrogenase
MRAALPGTGTMGAGVASNLEIIDGGPTGPPYAKLKGTNMVERRYEPNFSLKLARRDADLIAAVTDDLPRARLVSERMAAGHGDDDFSATVEAGQASMADAGA